MVEYGYVRWNDVNRNNRLENSNKMGNLLYRKKQSIFVQQITDEIMQIKHILHELLMLNVTKHFFQYAENEQL